MLIQRLDQQCSDKLRNRILSSDLDDTWTESVGNSENIAEVQNRV